MLSVLSTYLPTYLPASPRPPRARVTLPTEPFLCFACHRDLRSSTYDIITTVAAPPTADRSPPTLSFLYLVGFLYILGGDPTSPDRFFFFETRYKQVEMTATATPGTTVWVYRNTVYGYPWYASVRRTLEDPAYSDWC